MLFYWWICIILYYYIFLRNNLLTSLIVSFFYFCVFKYKILTVKLFTFVVQWIPCIWFLYIFLLYIDSCIYSNIYFYMYPFYRYSRNGRRGLVKWMPLIWGVCQKKKIARTLWIRQPKSAKSAKIRIQAKEKLWGREPLGPLRRVVPPSTWAGTRNKFVITSEKTSLIY